MKTKQTRNTKSGQFQHQANPWLGILFIPVIVIGILSFAAAVKAELAIPCHDIDGRTAVVCHGIVFHHMPSAAELKAAEAAN